MNKREKWWYGFLTILIIAGFAAMVYASIRDKSLLWSIVTGILFIIVVIVFGGIFIGSARAERDKPASPDGQELPLTRPNDTEYLEH